MKPSLIVLCSLLAIMGTTAMPGHASPPSMVEPVFTTYASMSGTIEDVDPFGLRVTLLTDMGKKESFPVTKMSVLVGVGLGDRVSCEMNADGKVTKIVRAMPLSKGSPAPEPGG